jgi:hypothetical protein
MLPAASLRRYLRLTISNVVHNWVEELKAKVPSGMR